MNSNKLHPDEKLSLSQIHWIDWVNTYIVGSLESRGDEKKLRYIMKSDKEREDKRSLKKTDKRFITKFGSSTFQHRFITQAGYSLCVSKFLFVF